MQLRSLNSAVALFASTTAAISLSNFSPRVDNLPGGCNKVYESQISGCQASDFQNNAQCTQQCIDGLISIAKSINGACQNVDVPETSIIGVTLIGQLIPALCNGVQVTTVASSTTSSAVKSTPPPPATSSQAQSTSSSSLVDTSTPPAAASSSTAVASSTATDTSTTAAPPSSQSTNADNQPPPSTTKFVMQSAISTKTSSSSKSSSTGTSQKSNKDSGGGSPFDVQAVGNTGSDVKLGKTMALAAAVLALAWLA